MATLSDPRGTPPQTGSRIRDSTENSVGGTGCYAQHRSSAGSEEPPIFMPAGAAAQRGMGNW